MSADGTFYGNARWREVLASAPADPEAIGQSLRTDVKLFSAGQKQHDDIAILSFGRLL
jgi:serine phosphatase RsbU (regulator of sigma subunit)